MRKKTLLLVLLALAACQAWALSWTPYARIGGAALLSTNLSLEDEDVPARTSFALSMDAMPLSMTIGRHRFSLGIRGMLVSDSIKWRQRYLLGSTRAALLASYSIRLADWEVYADLGAGYGQVNGQDISFAYLEAGAGFWYRMTEWMAFGLGYEGLWRREYFDNIISASIRVMLPEGIVGGEA